MRIVHFVDIFAISDGAARVALQLGEGMAAVGHDVLMLTHCGTASGVRCSPEEASVFAETSGFERLPHRYLMLPEAWRWPASLPQLAWRLRQVLSDFRPDWIEIHGPIAECVFALARPNVKAVIDFQVHDPAWLPGGGWRRKLSCTLHRSSAGRARALTAPCRELVDTVADFFRLPRDAVACIPNGVDLARFGFERREPPAQPVIGVLGRLVPGKRPFDALRALHLLLHDLPQARLWFIGDGPLLGELEREAAVLRLESAVTFLGVRSDVPDLLRQSHILWHLSEREGFGIAVAEAMACGVPVVAADAVGTRETVAHGRAGVLVPVGDVQQVAVATLRLLRDPERYRHLATVARSHVEAHFSVERMIAAHLRLFNHGMA